MDDIAIKVESVSKDFSYKSNQASSLKSVFTNITSSREKDKKEIQHTLKNISFEIKKGEFFGIVGRNGSGKSTLLKLMAGIYQPNKGAIKVNGKLVPFIELGVGFNPELTGRENVYLNGALLGFSKNEIEQMYDEIVAFAELEKFMDQKLKNYSSGMQVRLAFSMAIRAKADILLIDEVLAVGDEAFQRKCYKYFAELRRNKVTVVFVTHSMEAVQQFCTKAMLIDKGHDAEIDSPHKIAQIYRELNDQDNITVKSNNNQKSGTKYVTANMTYNKYSGKHFLETEIKPKAKMDTPIIAIGINRDNGEQVYRWTSDEKIPGILNLSKKNTIKIELQDIFPVGVFTVDLFIKKQDRSKDYAVFNEITNFEIKNMTKNAHDTFWKIPEKVYLNGKEVKNVY